MDRTTFATGKLPPRALFRMPPVPQRLCLPAPKAEPVPAPPATWRTAAECAHTHATTAHGAKAATLPQLERICQLLTSTTVTERERTRAVACLRAGLNKHEAGRWLDKLLPTVRRRREHRNRMALLVPLAA
jgi:hypothetical protein